MGRFSKYLGKFNITVDDQELELDVQMKDVKKFLTLSSGKGMDEAGVEKMTSTFVDIMARSYPDEPVEETVSFVAKNFMSFMNELFIVMGWMKREDIEAQRKKFMEDASQKLNATNGQ
jgi:hypothetical protein